MSRTFFARTLDSAFDHVLAVSVIPGSSRDILHTVGFE